MKNILHRVHFQYQTYLPSAAGAPVLHVPCPHHSDSNVCGLQGDSRVIRCLEESREQLTQDCKVAIFEHMSSMSEDIDFNKPLKDACSAEIEENCAKVVPGHSRLIRCLQDGNRKKYSDKCQEVRSILGLKLLLCLLLFRARGDALCLCMHATIGYPPYSACVETRSARSHKMTETRVRAVMWCTLVHWLRCMNGVYSLLARAWDSSMHVLEANSVFECRSCHGWRKRWGETSA